MTGVEPFLLVFIIESSIALYAGYIIKKENKEEIEYKENRISDLIVERDTLRGTINKPDYLREGKE